MSAKLLTSQVPRLAYTKFSRMRERRVSSQGFFEWTTYHGIPMKANFRFREGNFTGYLQLKYNCGEEAVNELIETRAFIVAFGHKRWEFICPGADCKKKRRFLYFTDGPLWLCMSCLKLETPATQNVAYKLKRDKMSLVKAKQQMSARSIKNKLKFLKNYINLRQDIRNKLRI